MTIIPRALKSSIVELAACPGALSCIKTCPGFNRSQLSIIGTIYAQ